MMNGRERVDGQIVSCAAMRELMLIVAGSVRFEILWSLIKQPRNVSALAAELELAVPMVSGNLRLLRENGLVEAEQRKKNRIYRVCSGVEGSRHGQFVRLRICRGHGQWMVVQLPLAQRRSNSHDVTPDGELP